MIAFSNVTKQHGPQVLFLNVSFQINPGERVGLVGPNGAGKSTVFRLIAGEESVDAGSIDLPKKLGLGWFKQNVGDWKGRSALEETMSGAGEVYRLSQELLRLEPLLEDWESPDFDKVLGQYGEVQERFTDLDGYALEARAAEILGGLGLSQEQMDGDVGELSGGWKMRVALAKILLQQPEVMLLDEPTNYLDIESILWLEGFLQRFKGTVIMTCHDKEVMNRVVTRILEIDGGEILSYSGNYDFYEAQRVLHAEQREAAYQRQQAMMAKEIRFIERFKGQPSKASAVQSRAKKLDKIDKLAEPKRHVERSFKFKPCRRSGNEVVKIQAISKAYGERVVHDGLDLLVGRGDRIAIMGANGAGKTTLLKMMAGVTSPDQGEVKIGASVDMAYFAQHQMEQLDGKRTILQELEAFAPTANIGTLRNLAGAFYFTGDDVEKSVSVLSGGERARLAMAKILFSTPNLMLLDEPTNHLDIATKRSLVKALSNYEGTLVFVSHDRDFLRAQANKILELGGPDGPRLYPCGYDEYVATTGRSAPGMRELD